MSARFTIDQLSPRYQQQASAQLHGTPPTPIPGFPPNMTLPPGLTARPVAVAGQTKPARVKTDPRKPRPAKGQGKRASRVPRTRNGGKWTEAQYWQAVRSALRRGFRFWKPIVDALKAAKTPFRGPHGQRFAYLCAGCGKLHPRKAVNVDHVVPCGQLRQLDHIAGFLERLTAERSEDFQVLCGSCHSTKTAKERATTP
jgi:hypothetical protein